MPSEHEGRFDKRRYEKDSYDEINRRQNPMGRAVETYGSWRGENGNGRPEEERSSYYGSREIPPNPRHDFSGQQSYFPDHFAHQRYPYDTDTHYSNYDPLPHGPHTGKGPKNYTRSDERLHDDIAERLTRHGNIDATNIEVSVKEGVVTLSGTVQNRWQKRSAEDVADSVDGVKDVENRLKIEAF